MSDILTIAIVDATTNEIVVRELNANELEQHESDLASNLNLENELTAKAAARESALAKLADLGLTAEEIAAL